MITVKLTDEKCQTYGRMQWGPNVTHEVAEWTSELCSAGVIHYYEGETEQQALALAILMNPIHGGFSPARAWECEVGGPFVTDRTKSGCASLTTIREIAVPEVTVEQLVEAVLRVVLCVYDEPGWVAWAEKWLSGEDRSADAAAAAWDAAWAAARDAVDAARDAAVAAARDAADAARDAARAAAWAAARDAAWAAAWAVNAHPDLNIGAITAPILLPDYEKARGEAQYA